MHSPDADPQSIGGAYPHGSRVRARVVRIERHGVVAQLDDGTPAFVGEAEPVPGASAAHTGALRVGMRFEGLVLGFDQAHQRLQLALLRSQSDPWLNVADRYPVGSEVSGQVVQVRRGEVFVALEPGVVGRVPKAEVCPIEPDDLSVLLWRGDRVLATVARCDVSERRLVLSMRRSLERREAATDQKVQQQYVRGRSDRPSLEDRVPLLKTLKAEYAAAEGSEIPFPQPSARPARRALVVENETRPALDVEASLHSLGYQVDLAFNGQTATEFVHSQTYDLVCMDLGLDDISGRDIIQHLGSVQPQTPIVVITGDPVVTDGGGLGPQVVRVLPKPVDPDSLRSVLADLQDEQPPALAPHLAERLQVLAGASVNRLAESLSQLAERQMAASPRLRSRHWVVFEVDPATHAVTVVAQHGLDPVRLDTIRHDLWYSPVRDVAVDHDVLYDNTVDTRPTYYRHLRGLGAYSACLGVPITSSGATRYALLVLGARTANDGFREEDLDAAYVAAGLLAAAIERQELDRAVRLSQGFILAGRTSLEMVHELRNQHNVIRSQIAEIRRRYQKLTGSGDTISRRVVSDMVEDPLKEMGIASRDVARLITSHLNLVRRERPEHVNVNDVLERLGELLEGRAADLGIGLRLELADDLPVIRTVGVRIEHVFLNLMFNAIQQLGEQPLAWRSPELVVRTVLVDGDPRPIRVYFADNGPGIHGKHEAQLFSLGFTTRKEGTGFGLYVSRTLTQSVGGVLRLVENHVLAGATFGVELPVSI